MQHSNTITVPDLRQSPPPTLDAVADALLRLAVRDHAIDQDEATELLNWDLGTIAQFLALRLREFGFLSEGDVQEILDTHAPLLYH